MKIKCPSCQAVLNIPPAAAGKLVKCPCGTQLRAPSAPAGAGGPAPAAPKSQPGVASAAAAGQVVQRRPAAPTAVDAGLFDELTEGDLQPIGQAGMPAVGAGTTGGGASGNTSKLLQEHAATAGGGSGSNFRVGPLASRWVRLGAALVDGFIINLLMLPVVLLGTLVFMGMFVDVEGLRAALAAAQTDDEKAYIAGQIFAGLFLGYGLTSIIAGILPVTIYAIMVTKSGQTPGKKLCKVRIVRADNKQLPGFVKGVVVRSWLGQLVYSIPIVGLVGVLLIFGAKRQTLCDMMAGTIVVES
ncbi:RDD family protein [bacterium]|nr:RDD family protein [bacterium]